MIQGIGMMHSAYDAIYNSYCYAYEALFKFVICIYAKLYLLWSGEDEQIGEIWLFIGLESGYLAILMFEGFLLENEGYLGFSADAGFMGALIICLIIVAAIFQVVIVSGFYKIGPYGLKFKGPTRLPKLPIGRLRKFLTDILALCIVILLRYSFNGKWQCLSWILLVVEFQAACKLAHAPCDLVFFDVFVGAIMRFFMVYQKENDLDAEIAKFVLCMLIIYYMHWSTITPATTITSDIKQGSDIEDQKVLITIETNS